MSTLQDVMNTTSEFCQQNKEAFAVSGEFQATHHARVHKVLAAVAEEQGLTIEQAEMIPFETELGTESSRLYEELLAWQKSPTEDD